jgi:hypothetical protein
MLDPETGTGEYLLYCSEQDKGYGRLVPAPQVQPVQLLNALHVMGWHTLVHRELFFLQSRPLVFISR